MKEIKRNDMNEMTMRQKLFKKRRKVNVGMATIETSVMDGGPCPS